MSVFAPSLLKGVPVVTLHLLMVLGLGVALPSFASEQGPNQAGWLPKTLAEPFEESLLIASRYILSREGCDRLLEAKLSENSSPDNPKFIFTCADRRNATANFVYWQSDVDTNFVNDSYPVKNPDSDSTETLSEYEARLQLRLNNEDLVSACKLQLQELLGTRPIHIEESGIDVSQRGEQPVVVNFNYQVGTGAYAPKFTAVCRRDSFKAVNLRSFSRD